MEDWQACSRILYDILNYMGYNPWIIDARKQFFSGFGKYIGGLTRFISGSKGEGLANILQSDIDILIFHDDIYGASVIDGDNAVKAEDPSRYTFKVERDWSPPGYCTLVLTSRPEQFSAIELCLSAIDNGVICLQATKALNVSSEAIKATDATTKPIAGPSQPTILLGLLEFDNVTTLSCPCLAELDAWYKRPRHHDWPSESLQEDIISTPANVVPVGSKEGIFSEMEWRFCFNRAELKLIDSLNPTQTKVYVVLKMILKDHLKPENKEITSFIMKNVVFWICEKNPSSSFTSSTLLSWIYVGLQTLKNHIESGNLPYYMIPGRNLLEGKFLNNETKSTFLNKLLTLLESGVGIVHVCKTIELGLEFYNEGKLVDYGWKRNLAEVAVFHSFEQDPIFVDMKFDLLCLAGICMYVREIDILFPDMITLTLQGYTSSDMLKMFWYRIGLFLDQEKAAAFAELKTK